MKRYQSCTVVHTESRGLTVINFKIVLIKYQFRSRVSDHRSENILIPFLYRSPITSSVRSWHNRSLVYFYGEMKTLRKEMKLENSRSFIK